MPHLCPCGAQPARAAQGHGVRPRRGRRRHLLGLRRQEHPAVGRGGAQPAALLAGARRGDH
eukprot:427494-Prymnesium_polylepis.1